MVRLPFQKVKSLVDKAVLNSDLSLREKAFLIALIRVGTFARLRTIAAEGGMSIRTVKRARKSLLARGVIKLLGRSIYCSQALARWAKGLALLPRARTRKEVNTPVSTTTKAGRIINRRDDNDFVREVRAHFRRRKITKRSWADYDSELAHQWHRKGVPIRAVLAAIDTGCARIYASKRVKRINSLRYFEGLLMEPDILTGMYPEYARFACERAETEFKGFAYGVAA